MPGVWVQAWVVGSVPGWGAYKSQPIDVSLLHVSLSLSVSPPFFPLPSFLSVKAMKTCPWMRIKKIFFKEKEISKNFKMLKADQPQTEIENHSSFS